MPLCKRPSARAAHCAPDLSCAEKGIGADIEVIPIQRINEAYDRMLKNDVRYRFVIGLASLKGAA